MVIFVLQILENNTSLFLIIDMIQCMLQENLSCDQGYLSNPSAPATEAGSYNPENLELASFVRVYTCQNATLLEILCGG